MDDEKREEGFNTSPEERIHDSKRKTKRRVMRSSALGVESLDT